MSKRSLRRHHARRMKAKARRVASFSWGYSLGNNHSPDGVSAMMKYAEKCGDYLARCSNYCCGNPRKWFKEPTLAERTWAAQAAEQIE